MDITELLAFTAKQNASDLHLSAGLPPMMRVDGDIRRLNSAALDNAATRELLDSVMNEAQREEFERELEIDFSYEVAGVSRFRVNLFHQDRGVAGVFRTIAANVPSLEELELGEVFRRLASCSHGLVLVTGPTGSGKSTTLAAMLDYINATRHQHVLTIEDPIEFVHHSRRALINQREVSRDTHAVNNALRSALREDPDVLLVGELRDLETMRLALTAAETGHLVLATLHTTSAAKTVDRVVDVFPGEEKAMIRSMLSESLRGVISQRLIKRIGGGRIAAHEILIVNSAVRNLIREDKVAQIYSAIQTGGSLGMQTMESALTRLASEGVILHDDYGL
ncbi:type IV pilus twitching motility protein PilT [Kushneria aurantia]|uniref:Type IV pilus twitching motility protein PilT n=1 Tax=Kushneria aurantia TaxID=504092 RepID=A0ABV6G6A4_9GAMM|nr:type IV pilus twitching motility protein PilT [Kushneria aurantia]